MLYECSCSFTAETATAFYKHLAQSKDDTAATSHQLVQAKFTEAKRTSMRGNKVASASAAEAEATNEIISLVSPPPSDRANPRAADGDASWANIGSWVKEYLPPEASQKHEAAVAARTARASTSNVDAGEVPSLSRSPGIDATVAAQLRHRHTSSAAAALSSLTGDDDDSEMSSLPPLPVSTSPNTLASLVPISLPPSASAALQAGSSMLGVLTQVLNPLKLFGLVAFDNKTGRDMQRADERPIPFSASWGVAVPAVEEILMWKQPWHSAKVFGLGLYLLLCYSQLCRGSQLLQPSTAILFVTFLMLIVNSARNTAIGAAKSDEPLAAAGSTALSGLHSSENAPIFAKREQAVFDRASLFLSAVAAVLIPHAAAAVALYYRALSGRRLITSVLVATCLWGGMVLGELRVMNQTMFCALVYIALFTMPALYVRSRSAMDSVVEDLMKFVARAVVNGNRSSVLLGATAFLVIIVWAPLNIIIRTSLAAVVGFSMLLWRMPGRQSIAIHQEVT